nr:hypothetical protein GCM10020063_091090 [Dactylosporangium thailandense]
MFGPGVSTIPSATSATPATAPTEIMSPTLPVRPATENSQSAETGVRRRE